MSITKVRCHLCRTTPDGCNGMCDTATVVLRANHEVAMKQRSRTRDLKEFEQAVEDSTDTINRMRGEIEMLRRREAELEALSEAKVINVRDRKVVELEEMYECAAGEAVYWMERAKRAEDALKQFAAMDVVCIEVLQNGMFNIRVCDEPTFAMFERARSTLSRVRDRSAEGGETRSGSAEGKSPAA